MVFPTTQKPGMAAKNGLKIWNQRLKKSLLYLEK